jgi:hypothetical protein
LVTWFGPFREMTELPGLFRPVEITSLPVQHGVL